MTTPRQAKSHLAAPLLILVLATAVGCDENNANPAAPGSSGSAAAAAATPALAAGDAAPDVTLTLHDGKTVALSSLQGKHVLVYFYPKDDTPGCRVEAQGVRDAWEDFQKKEITVYGVSLQDATSHQAFIDKESLPFPLVVDDGSIAKAFRVPVRGEFAARHSFLIGPDGKLKRVWLDVDPKTHAAEVLAAAGG